MKIIQSILFLATALTASAATCTADQLTAPDGRQVRFTGGGGSFKRGTEQDISFDIPTGTEMSGLANIYLRDVNGKAYQVVNKGISGGAFPQDRDATASGRFVVPPSATGSLVGVPTGTYFYYANFRLRNGGTCSFGSNTSFQLK